MFLPTKLKIPSISRIGEVTGDMKARIDFINAVFNTTEKNVEETIKLCLPYLKKEDQTLSPLFVFSVIFHYLRIRPHYRAQFAKIIKDLHYKFSFRSTILCAASINSDTYHAFNSDEQELMIELGIEEREEDDDGGHFHFLDKKSLNELKNIYKADTIEFAIKNDDIDGIKKWLNKQRNSNDALVKKTIKIDSNSPLYIANRNMETANLLHIAAFFGSVKTFKYLVSNRLRIDEKCCPLVIASGNIELINLVEKQGMKFTNCFETALKFHRNDIADWLLTNFQCEKIPMYKCIEYFNLEAFLFLKGNGFDINEPFTITRGILNKRFTFTSITKAADDNVIDFVKIVVENGGKIDGEGPLSAIACAAQFGNLEIMKYLIEHGANYNGGNTFNNIPIIAALHGGHHKVIEYLLEKNVNLDLVESTEKGDITPVTIACRKESPNLLKMLLKFKVDLNKGNPLYSTAKTNLKRTAQLLVENGADVNQMKKGKTPLTISLKHNLIEMAKFLIQSKADVNLGKITPLQQAIEKNSFNAVNLLLQNGADPNLLTSTNETPLFMAISQKSLPITRVLLEHKADPNKECKAKINKNEYVLTPLEYAAALNQINIVHVLLDHGADVKKGSPISKTKDKTVKNVLTKRGALA